MKRKIVSMLLVLCMLLSVVPLMQINTAASWEDALHATWTQDDQEGYCKVWMEGMDGSTSDFRVAQLIQIKTAGFGDEAVLQYTYYYKYKSTSFINLIKDTLVNKDRDVYLYNSKANIVIKVLDFHEPLFSGEKVKTKKYDSFAHEGAAASNSTVEVTVKDVGKDSTTYGRTATCKLNGFKAANLNKDCTGSVAMFEGDSMVVGEFAEQLGIRHFCDCDSAYWDKFDINNMDEGTIELSGAYINALHRGWAKYHLELHKGKYCYFHAGQKANTNGYFRVFQRPTVTPSFNSFILTDTEGGVTYKIRNYEATAQYDGQWIVFDSVPSGESTLEISTRSMGQKVTAYMDVETIDAAYVQYNYDRSLEGITNISDTLFTALNEATPKPDGPYAYGYIVSDWYEDAAYTQLHDFDAGFCAEQLRGPNVQLYANWIPMRSRVVLTLTNDGSPYVGQKVQLYKNGVPMHTLNPGASAGSYESSGSVVETGTYDVYVNGQSIKASVKIFPKVTAKEFTAKQISNRDSGETIRIDLNLHSLKAITRIDGVEAPVDYTYSMVDQSGTYHTVKNGADNAVSFVNGDNTVYTIYSGSVNKKKTVSQSARVQYFDFYDVGLVVQTTEADWVSKNVYLYDTQGNYICPLPPGEYDTATHTRKYTALFEADTKAVPTRYMVELDGNIVGENVSAVKGNTLTQVRFLSSRVTLTLNGQPYAGAEILCENSQNSFYYTTGDNGALNIRLFDGGEDYSMQVLGAQDSHAYTIHTEKDSNDFSVDYCTADFYTSALKDGAVQYNSKLYFSYTVCKGDTISVPGAAYLKGHTFECWNEARYVQGEVLPDSFDFTAPITEKTVLYAHFSDPALKINGTVRSDEDGRVSVDGTYYSLTNLAMSGFDAGNVITCARITGENIAEILLPADDNVTLSLSGESAPEAVNGKYTVTGKATDSFVIHFTQKVSAAEAQAYLRRILFVPTANAESTLTVKASETMLSIYSAQEVTQSEGACSDSFTVIDSDITDTRTFTSGSYFFSKDVTISNTTAGAAGCVIDGTVSFYIPTGVTLTVKGSAGTDAEDGGQSSTRYGGAGGKCGTTGGAGIYLAAGNTLNVYGDGKLAVTGGKGGNAGAGGSGARPFLDYSSNICFAGPGGGGGGGAGIGTGGANGGNGGNGGIAGGCDYSYQSYNFSGNMGVGGSAGCSVSNTMMGSLKVAPEITMDVFGGAGGDAGAGGDSAGSWTLAYGCLTAGTGGSGGGGGAPGYAIGSGGYGGGGGCGGSSGCYGGGYYGSYSNVYGPFGGYGFVNGGKGQDAPVSGSYLVANYNSGGGYGGASGSGGFEGYYNNNLLQKTYRIYADTSAYGGSVALLKSYQVGVAAKVTLPMFAVPAGLDLKGWKFATYSKTLGAQAVGNYADDTVYTDDFTLSPYCCGDLVLQPVLVEDKDVKSASDSVSISTKVPTAYYTYTVSTEMNGVHTDLGAIRLVNTTNSADTLLMGSDGNGNYSYVSESGDAVYKIYLDGVYTGKTVKAGTTTVLSCKSYSVELLLDGAGYDGKSVRLSDGSNSLPCTAAGNGAYILRTTAAVSGPLTVYVDNENTGKTVSAGGSVTLSYCTVRVTVTGNAKVNSAELRCGKNRFKLTQSGEVYEAVRQADDTVYDIYLNSKYSGKTVSFTPGKNAASVAFNTITVKTYLDGVLFNDAFYVPTYSDFSFTKNATGTYQRDVFGTVGKVTVAGSDYELTDNALSYKFYTVKYDLNGGTGTVPADSGYYVAGDTVTVTQAKSFSKEGFVFAGWKLGDKTYRAGETFAHSGSPVMLTAVYKSCEDFDVIIVKNGEPFYADAEEIAEYLKDKTPEDTMVIYVLPGGDITLPGMTIDETTELVIPSSTKVTIPEGETIVNNGSVVIENGGSLDNDGTIENNGDITNGGTFTNGGTVKNPGDITNGGTFTNGGTVENPGEFENTGDIILDGDGFVNDGTIINGGKITSQDGDGDDTLTNHGTIENEDGTIDTTVQNEDEDDGGIIKGNVFGGTLTKPGVIDGGKVDGVTGDGTIHVNNTIPYKLILNGGTAQAGVVTSGDYTFGTVLTLPTAVSRENFTFDGWYIDENFVGDAETQINFSGETGARCLYYFAKWKAVTTTQPDGSSVVNDGTTTLTVQVETEIDATAEGLEEAALTIKETDNKQDNVKMILTVDNKDDIDTEGQKKIKEANENNSKIRFLDCTVMKYVNDDTVGSEVTELNDIIEVVIPMDARGIIGIQPVCYHDGNVEFFFDSDSQSEGTFYIEGSGANTKVHLFTSKFCDYAMLYTENGADGVEYYASLTLNENIDLNLQMENLGSSFKKELLTITVDGVTIPADAVYVEDSVAFCVLKEVEPKNIGNNVHVVVSYNGVPIKEIDYAVTDYCNAVLNARQSDTTGYYDKLANLCEALLNYGKYAEDYENHTTNSFLNYGHAIELVAPAASNKNIVMSDNITAAAASLGIDSTISLIFYVQSTKPITAKDVVIRNNILVTKNNQRVYETVDSENIEVTESDVDGYNYKITIRNIYAEQMWREYTLTIVGDKSFSATYGVFDYCYEAQTQFADNATLTSLCKAIYMYGRDAKIFADSVSA